MNAFLQALASFPIPVEEIMWELAWVAVVVVWGLYLLVDASPRWAIVPALLFVLSVWLWWRLDQFPRG